MKIFTTQTPSHNTISPQIVARLGQRPFVGRQWLTQEIDRFLANTKHDRGVFDLVASAGLGKTAFLAHLVQTRGYLHLFGEQFSKTSSVIEARLSLAAQLVQQYAIADYADPATLKEAAQNDDDLLASLLGLAAQRLRKGQKITIVCDALDEACRDGHGQAFGLPAKLPSGVYLILSRRPESVPPDYAAALQREGMGDAYQRYVLKHDEPDQVHDLRAYLTLAAQSPAIAPQLQTHGYSADQFVAVLLSKCEGMWMHARALLDEFEQGTRTPAELDQLPQGLIAYYAEQFLRSRKQHDNWSAVHLPFLTTLAAIAEPLPLKTILKWSGLHASRNTIAAVQNLIRTEWSGYIAHNTTDDTYQFNHATLREFFSGDLARLSFAAKDPAATVLLQQFAALHKVAHKRIIGFLRVACGGDWVRRGVAHNYTRQHLMAHLLHTGHAQHVRETHKIAIYNDAWAKAREQVDQDYGGYLADVALVWRRAEQEATWDMAVQLRCALIQASIFALAGTVPARLLKQLVEIGDWTPARALDTALRKPDEDDRVEAIVALIPLLKGSPSLLQRVMQAALALSHDSRAAAMIGLLTQLEPRYHPPLLENIRKQGRTEEIAVAIAALGHAQTQSTQRDAEIMALWQAIPRNQDRLEALTMLIKVAAPRIRKQVMAEFLPALSKIKNRYERVWATVNSLPHLPQPQRWATAIALYKTMRPSQQVPHYFGELVSQLPSNMQREALTALASAKNDKFRVRALIDLMSHNTSEAIKAIVLRMMHQIGDDKERLQAWVSALPHLPKAQQPALAAEAYELWQTLDDADAMKARHIIVLVRHLAPSLQQRAAIAGWQVIEAQHEPGMRRMPRAGFWRLYPFLPAHLQTKLLALACAEASQPTTSILLNVLKPIYTSQADADDDDHEETDLQSLAKILTTRHKRQLVQFVRNVPYEAERVAAFNSLVAHFSAAMLPAAAALVRGFSKDQDRTQSLSLLAEVAQGELKHRLIRESLHSARFTHDEEGAVSASTKLSQYLPAKQWQGYAPWVLGRMQHTSQQHYADLLKTLPARLHSDVLRHAQQMKDPEVRAEALIDLLPHLAQPLVTACEQAAFQAIQVMPKPNVQVRRWLSLLEITPRYKDFVTPTLVENLINIQQTTDKAILLAKIVLFLPESDQQRLLDLAWVEAERNSAERYAFKVSMIANHIKELPQAWRAQWLERVRKLITANPNRLLSPLVVEKLALYFSSAEISQWWHLALQQRYSELTRIEIATAFYPHVTQSEQTRILEMVRQAKSPKARLAGMMEILPHRPAESKSPFATEGYKLIQHLRDPQDVLEVLTSLMPHLQGDLQEQAIARLNKAAHRLIQDDPEAASEIEMQCGLLQVLPERHQRCVLDLLRNAQDDAQVTQWLADDTVMKALPDPLKRIAITEIFRRSGNVAVWQNGPTLSHVLAEWQRLGWADMGDPRPHWVALLHAGASVARATCLAELVGLVPLIQHPALSKDGQRVASAFAAAIRDVYTWWP